MRDVSIKELLDELRRRIDGSSGIERQNLVYEVFAITRDNLTYLSTGNLCDLESRCEEEKEKIFDAEHEYHFGPSTN